MSNCCNVSEQQEANFRVRRKREKMRRRKSRLSMNISWSLSESGQNICRSTSHGWRTMLIKNDKKKPGGGCKSSAQVWNHQKHMFFSLTPQAKIKGWLKFESQLAGRHDEVKMIVEHQLSQCKDRWKLWAPFGGELQKGVSY